MNLIPEVVKLLGVEIGKEFDIILDDCTPSVYNPFKFTEDGLKAGDMISDSSYLVHLITGYYTIRKIPFKPKKGDVYWYWCKEIQKASKTYFDNCSCDYTRWKIGNCFRTKEEAETKGKELTEQIIKEHENE